MRRRALRGSVTARLLLKLEPELLARVRSAAARTGVSVSEWARRALTAAPMLAEALEAAIDSGHECLGPVLYEDCSVCGEARRALAVMSGK